MGKRVGLLALLVSIAAAGASAGEAIKPAPIWDRPHEAKRDRVDLELNLRWMLARQRRGEEAPVPAGSGPLLKRLLFAQE